MADSKTKAAPVVVPPGATEVERSRAVAAAKDAADGKPKTKEERAAVKRANFVRVAPKRVQRVLTALRRLRQTANPAGYEFSDEQAGKIIEAITRAVDECFSAFERKNKKDDLFTL